MGPDIDIWRAERDVVCLTCGYNLRTLPANARCPECGAPVHDSLRQGAQYANPRMLRQRGAAALVQSSLATMAALGVVLGLLGEWLHPEPRWVGIVALLATIAAGASQPFAVWRATAPVRGLSRSRREKWLIGYSTAVAADFALIPLLAITGAPGPMSVLVAILGMVLLFSLPLFLVFLGGHFARWCDYAGAPRLSRAVQHVFFFAAMGIGLVAVLDVAAGTGSALGPIATPLVAATIFVAGLTALYALLGGTILLACVGFRLRSRAREIGRQDPECPPRSMCRGRRHVNSTRQTAAAAPPCR